MLCHMVHMALCMVDEPLEFACTPVYPVASHVPNHSMAAHALARSTALTFARSRDLCLARSAHLLGLGSTSPTITYTPFLDYCTSEIVRGHVDRVSHVETLRMSPVSRVEKVHDFTLANVEDTARCPAGGFSADYMLPAARSMRV
jgi:hypothetical protein